MTFKDEIKSPTFWATLAGAATLIGQLFTESGNATLAGVGGTILGIYAAAKQVANAVAGRPVDAATPDTQTIEHTVSRVHDALTDLRDAALTIKHILQGWEITPIEKKEGPSAK